LFSFHPQWHSISQPIGRYSALLTTEMALFRSRFNQMQTVGMLKKAIKLERQPEFNGIDADRLTLFEVDVPALDLSKASEQIDGFDLASMKMNPVLKLSEYYSTTP
jgi:Crinkler effector protein N-terminal domain